jgi:hypothetical protein
MPTQIHPLRLEIAAIFSPFARSNDMLALFNMNMFLAAQYVASTVLAGFVAFLASPLSVLSHG